MNKPFLASSEIADRYEAVATQLGHRVLGRERSLKITSKHLNDQRWLLGFDKTDLGIDQLLPLMEPLGIPSQALNHIASQWDRANFAYWALDLDGPSKVKLYLEFPVLLSVKTAGQTDWQPPSVWCQGYKWTPGRADCHITHYALLPGVGAAQFERLHPVFNQDHTWSSLLSWLTRLENDSKCRFDILSLDTAPQARGVDFRVYDANVSMQSLAHTISPLIAAWLGQELSQQLHALLQPHKDHVLGHLSFGWDNAKQKYLNLYWESLY